MLELTVFIQMNGISSQMLFLTVFHQQLNPAEEERRRLRRERNKLAAAKCRNHRKELTDQLQGVSPNRENDQSVNTVAQPTYCFVSIDGC